MLILEFYGLLITVTKDWLFTTSSLKIFIPGQRTSNNLIWEDAAHADGDDVCDAVGGGFSIILIVIIIRH